MNEAIEKVIEELENRFILECEETEMFGRIRDLTVNFPSPCIVEQYEAITGEKFPDDGLVWCLYPYETGFFWKQDFFWKVHTYGTSETGKV